MQLFLQLCVYVSVQERGEGKNKNPTKTGTAGEGGLLSKNGITEATNSVDLQGTLNHFDGNHFVLQIQRDTREKLAPGEA